MARKKTDIWERALSASRALRALLEDPTTFEREDATEDQRVLLEGMPRFMAGLASSLERDIRQPESAPLSLVSQTIEMAESITKLARNIASRSTAIPDAFKDGAPTVATNHVTHALLQAIHIGTTGQCSHDKQGTTLPI